MTSISHHSDLFYGLQLLFEKRLGHLLYRPTGIDWFKERYWKIAEPYENNPATINQFLKENSIPEDGSLPLNDVRVKKEGIFAFEDKHNNHINFGITLDAFKKEKFDIIIATIPEHIEPYKKLIREYQPQAKFVLQVGNILWDQSVNFSNIDNLMSSTARYIIPDGTNAVFYHQEFDLEVFKPQNKNSTRQITSFINCLAQTGWGSQYYILKSSLPECSFKSYGGSNDDGIVGTTHEVANIMNSSYFGFHAKMYGDGFGHILHNWFACGKPVITHISDYKDKLGGKLLVDGETCIDLDKHELSEVVNFVRDLSPEKYEWMCQQCYQKFKQVVDYDKEEVEIRKFLGRLL